MLRRLAVLVLIASSCPLALGGDIYRWVDENGRTHFGDAVPEKYKKSATKVDQSRVQSLPEDAAAVQRVPQGKGSPSPGGVLQQPQGSAQTRGPAPLDCDAMWREYNASVDCFAPYVTRFGAVRAEAYQHCKVLPDPSPRCGPAKPELKARGPVPPESSERTYIPAAPASRQ